MTGRDPKSTSLQAGEGAIFEFLRKGPDHTDHPVDRLRQLREYVADLPETKAVIKLGDTPLPKQCPFEKYLVLIDSWPIPERFTGEQHQTGVNPDYVHRETYTDAAATCECGAVINTTRGGADNCRLASCNSYYLSQARTEVWERRADIIKQSLRYQRTDQYIAARVGAASPQDIHRMYQDLNIDQSTIREKGKQRLKGLLEDLSERFTHTELAVAFDIPRSTISSWINGG